jgi:hypothetical protein
VRRLFEERGLLTRLTRLKVGNWHPLPPLPGPPDPERCPGGMRMEALELRAGLALTPAAAATAVTALAAWPMPRLRRLVLSSADPAALRTLLRAPWAAGLQDLELSVKGALRGGVRVSHVWRPDFQAKQWEHACH